MILYKPLSNQFFKVFIAFIGGCCGILSFSPFNLWFMSIISLIILLVLISKCKSKQASFLGFIWGMGLFFTGINWILISMVKYGNLSYISSIIILVALVIYLSFYPSMFAFFLTLICPKNDLYRLVIYAPIIWFITESLRSHIMTGFPWLEFGYSQIDGPLRGVAPILGVRAITFFLVMISGLIIFEVSKYRIPLLSISVIFIFKLLNPIHWYHKVTEKTISVALVQGNILQSEKWESDKINSILKIYLDNTLPILGKVQLIVWPESAISDLEVRQKRFLIGLDEKLSKTDTSLVTGIISTKVSSNGISYYNSIISLGKDSKYKHCLSFTNRYDKHHLVPFGETNIIKIPLITKITNLFFKNSLIYFSQGKYLQPQIKLVNLKFTPTICYEIIFGNQLRDNFHKDTDLLINLSDDTWFDNSIGPWQHFQMARMRSLELGRPLLRSSNNGITAIIDADGSVQAQLPQFICKVLNIKVVPSSGLTPYAKNGYKLLWLYIIIVTLITIIIYYYSMNNKQ